MAHHVGFPVAADSQAYGEPHEPEGISKLDLVRIGIVGVAVLFCWLRISQPYPRLDLVELAPVLAGGYPIYREALQDLLSRRMTMELSMTIALAAALVISEVFTALVIVFFVLIAEMLEELTVERGRRAIKDLLAFLPEIAEIRAAIPGKLCPSLLWFPVISSSFVPAPASRSMERFREVILSSTKVRSRVSPFPLRRLLALWFTQEL
jgi:hypothetical protein